MADVEDEIDRLYQGDLEGFIAARNALAKAAKRADLKTLPKPSLPAWAVNQLYWRHRLVFSRLVARAEAVREQHRLVLSNRPADVRAAEAAHRETLREALDAARQALMDAGHPVTPATLEAITRTLEELPSPDANGRLVKPLTPRGFDALGGVAVSGGRPALRVLPGGAAPPPVASPDDQEDRAARAAEERAERARTERAERERRAAAQKALDAARQQLTLAELALAEAERALSARRGDHARAVAAVELATRALDH